MTPDEFASALAEFAPDDTKVIMTSTSDAVVFSAIPRNKDSESLPERHYAVRFPENSTEIPYDAMDFARLALFPEHIAAKVAQAEAAQAAIQRDFNAKQAELTASEEKSKERVAEKIEAASKKTGARFKREIK